MTWIYFTIHGSVPGTWIYFLIKPMPLCSGYYYPYFTDEKIAESQRS